MSPIIDLQRRLVEVGRIRMGDRGGTNGAPRKLTSFRLTSRDQIRLQAAADLYGGTVKPWDAREGEFELYTEADTIPIMLLPGQAISMWYEAWSGGGCVRRCDGETETLTDGPCLCDPEKRECKPTTRLSVMLPEVPGLGRWRLETHGWYAATELAPTVEFLETHLTRGQVVPARLRIDQRVKVSDGQTRRFAVPVIDIDARLPDVLSIAAGSPVRGELEPAVAYTPVQQLPAAGVTVEEGLAGAEASANPRSSNGREAAPIPNVDDVPFGNDTPVPVPVPADNEPGATVTVTKPTQAQIKKLNVLVGKLRDAGTITTEHLWAAMARERNVAVDHMIELLEGRDADGTLHWTPLRDSLTRTEASGLIDRLAELEAKAAS